jgi:hypothetical protein
MFAQVHMSPQQRETLMIPRSALVYRGQLTGVYTLSDNNRAVLRWVRTGEESGDRVEILTGLKAGEQFVAAMDQPLRQGQPIRVQ